MANRVRELRKSRNLTQQQLADMIGTTKQQVGRLENSKRRLSDHWVERLSQVMKIHPGELWAEVPGSSSELTPQEQAMLDLFRNLSDEQRSALVRLTDTMAQPKLGRKDGTGGT